MRVVLWLFSSQAETQHAQGETNRAPDRDCLASQHVQVALDCHGTDERITATMFDILIHTGNEVLAILTSAGAISPIE